MSFSVKRKCPICGKELTVSIERSIYGPFCSIRCKEIDLLNWLDEKYFISRYIKEEDIEEDLGRDTKS